MAEVVVTRTIEISHGDGAVRERPVINIESADTEELTDILREFEQPAQIDNHSVVDSTRETGSISSSRIEPATIEKLADEGETSLAEADRITGKKYVICSNASICPVGNQRFVLSGEARYCPTCGHETDLVKPAPEDVVTLRVDGSVLPQETRAKVEEEKREIRYAEGPEVIISRIIDIVDKSFKQMGREDFAMKKSNGPDGLSYVFVRPLEPEVSTKTSWLGRERKYSTRKEEYLGFLALATDSIGNVSVRGFPSRLHIGESGNLLSLDKHWALWVYGRDKLPLLQPPIERLAKEVGVRLDVVLQNESSPIVCGTTKRIE